jgi:DNA polymerase-3 subunit chi
MAEILFYHLQSRPLEAVLPTLVVKSRERGWRVVIEASSPERVKALDELLWTYSEESFLPHATAEEPGAEAETVVITSAGTNPNAADIRFLVDGAPMPEDAESYSRLVLLFDGGDEEALARARAAWTAARAGGHAATYWQQDDRGRWEKKA